jgi:N-methylhydantoinase A
MAFRVGVDIGGTFTDFTVVDDRGQVTLWKEDSTSERPVAAIETGLVAISKTLEIGLDEFLRSTSLFVHGSTIATNTLIQRSGPTIGLLCTEGFRDVIYFRDGFKPERFNIHLPHPVDFVDRYLRLGVTGRINAKGQVLTPLDEGDVRAAAARFRESDVAAVAVAFLWSIVNPEHERHAGEILAEELPGVEVILSSDVLPEIREWERTSATVLSAYILPGISNYLRELEGVLAGAGFGRSPLIMQINGGCASVEEILRRPVFALASGPAAAPAAASFHAETLDTKDLITVDMGGTSFDVCLIRDGRPSMSRTIQVEHQPIGVSGVEVQSIGAGGGSIAWIDAGDALRVGPRSAGARPGPACYGFGGMEPTVTDANVVLGYLQPEAFLGGRRTLRADLAERAVHDHVAARLGLDTLRAAAGIIEVVNANMVDAIRAVSIERGVDPRGFVLVAGGGAGGLHATRLARRLGMTTVLVPQEAGTFCAFGMTVTDVRHDHSRALHALTSTVELGSLNGLFEELEEEGRRRLHNDGFTDDQIVLERSVDCRYPNQVHELTIQIPSGGAYTEAELRSVESTFHAEHKRRFTYFLENLPVECLHWRVTAIGRMPVDRVGSSNGGPADDQALARQAHVGSRDAYFAGAMSPTNVFSAELLEVGARVDGPAIIQAATTTILLDDRDVLTVRPDRGFAIELLDA